MAPVSSSSKAVPTVIICPGNGCADILRSNWYGTLHQQLRERNIPCICRDFPDPYAARRSVWIPHIHSLAESTTDNGGGGDADNVVLVGHSSGAQAALRYAEIHPCRAAVLVAAAYSDLGDPSERASGYYPLSDTQNLYDFASMKKNCPVWYQFHSDNDPFIPLPEAEQIRDGLGLVEDDTYIVLPGRSHFFEPFDELLKVIERIVEH